MAGSRMDEFRVRVDPVTGELRRVGSGLHFRLPHLSRPLVWGVVIVLAMVLAVYGMALIAEL